MTSLLEGEEEEKFFENLRSGSPSYKERWLRFLKHLARAINNSHLLYDTVFVLGGYLAQHLIDADIDLIYDEIERLSPFPEHRDFVRISKMPVHNITIGSALPYIKEFLDRPIPASHP
jgi:predicted NBD/HSP70 family sugar kinase